MNCQNCGAAVSGEFCAECGAKFIGVASEVQPAVARKAPAGKSKLLITLVLAIAAVGSATFGVVQQTQANTFAAAEIAADKKVSEFQDSADTWSGLLESAKSSKETCYYAWWCTTSTYSTWISLVNTDQSYYDDALASVDEWQSKSNIARNSKTSAESSRTLGFSGAGVFGIGLVVYVVATRRKPEAFATIAE